MTLRNGPDTAQVEEIINSTVTGHNETKQKEIVKLSLSLSMSTDGLYIESSWTDSFGRPYREKESERERERERI